jgi:protein-disulfide isomerase
MKESMIIPIAILVAGFIIALGIYQYRERELMRPVEVSVTATRPVTLDDHIIGLPTAPITIITYSDIDCTYCKQLQETMKRVMQDYGSSGQVAWAYRHFPLTDIHPDALAHALASECVAYQTGTDGFFDFIDALQDFTKKAGPIEVTEYPLLVKNEAFSTEKFQTCLSDTKAIDKVNNDIRNGMELGITSTPHIVIAVEGHTPQAISGALPYDSMIKLIQNSLNQLSKENTQNSKSQ